jgi:protocatechuate 3,4-dioxygenase beta subunit
MMDSSRPTRRQLVGGGLSLLGAALAIRPTLGHALALIRTPSQSRGPFYPTQLPLDHDNDLVQVAGRPGLARGRITNVIGRVLTESGRPVAGARVEIWQCNAWGRYHHPRDTRDAPLDPNFQGYGQTVTGPDGAYRFRTIKPVPYPGRTPHIHYAVSGPGFGPLITQLYVEGEPGNEHDVLLNSIRDPRARQSLIVPFVPDPDSARGELVARFDLVLADDGRLSRADDEYWMVTRAPRSRG